METGPAKSALTGSTEPRGTQVQWLSGGARGTTSASSQFGHRSAPARPNGGENSGEPGSRVRVAICRVFGCVGKLAVGRIGWR